jgi:DNA gyrase/topoisomerase IV subunit A
MGRATRGVRGIKLKKGDEVLSMVIVRDTEGDLVYPDR